MIKRVTISLSVAAAMFAALVPTQLATAAEITTAPAQPSGALDAVATLRDAQDLEVVDGQIQAVPGQLRASQLDLSLRDSGGSFEAKAWHVEQIGVIVFPAGNNVAAVAYDAASGRTYGSAAVPVAVGPVEDAYSLIGSVAKAACQLAVGRIPGGPARLAGEAACYAIDAEGGSPPVINPTQVYWYNSGPGTGAVEAQVGYPGLWTYLFDVSARPVDTTAAASINLAFDLYVHGVRKRIIRTCSTYCPLVSIQDYQSYEEVAGAKQYQQAAVLQSTPVYGYIKLGQAVRLWTF